MNTYTFVLASIVLSTVGAVPGSAQLVHHIDAPTATLSPDSVRNRNATLHSGRLEPGDRRFRPGRYFDEYPFDAAAGEQITILLRAAEFHPELSLVTPGKIQFVGPAGNGEAQLAMLLVESGRHVVRVTSEGAGDTGSYTVSIDRRDGASVTPARTEHGELTLADHLMPSGRFLDRFVIHGWQRQAVTIDLRSEDFDPRLIVRDPSGNMVQTDSELEGTQRIVNRTLVRSGTYSVSVTSAHRLQQGRYSLTIRIANPKPPTEFTEIRFGEHVIGKIEAGNHDSSPETWYSFHGVAGERVGIELESSEFWPWIELLTPGGALTRPDRMQHRSRSRIEWTLPEGGRYALMVTVANESDGGAYELTLTSISAASPDTNDERRF